MTIRKKLQIMAVSAVVTMVMLVGMMIFSINEIKNYEEVHASVAELEVGVLKLRKYEKDFIARNKWKYVEKHQKGTNELVSLLDHLINETGHYTNEEDKNLAIEFKKTILNYSNGFTQLAAMTKTLGLDEKSGVYGDLRNTVRDVETLIKGTYKHSASADQLTKDVLMLRRREKDFMLRLDLKYQGKFKKDYAIFMKDLAKADLSRTVKSQIKVKMAAYQQTFDKFIETNVARGLDEKSGLLGQMRHEVHALDEIQVKLQALSLQGVESVKQWLEGIAVLFSLLFAIALQIYIFRTSKSVSDGLKDIVASIKQTNTSCEFKHPIQTNRQDEFGEIALLFNELLNSVDSHFEEVNQVMQNVADGEFSARIQSDAHGDFERLTIKVNSALNTMEELEKMISSMGKGDFTARLSDNIANPLKDLVNSAVSSTEQTLLEVCSVMERVANADFSSSLDRDVKGQWQPMQVATNNAIAELKSTFNEMNSVFEKMALGDLTVAMPASSKGELAKLSKNFNVSMTEMREAMSEVSSVSVSVKEDIGSIFQANQVLTQNTTENAALIEETTSALEEMFTTIQQNTQNTQQSNSLAEETSELASSGSEIMKRTIDNMSGIRDSSDKISDIVNIIDSIAFQTNLLALNAAVEAARAGEHGRGFAVVAGEVRNLSGRSADAATQIKKLITESVGEVSKGTELSEQSGQSLEQVVTAIHKMKKMVERIAISSHEQSGTADEIGKAVAVMGSNAQENSSQMEHVGEIASSMVASAEIMQQKINRFKI